MKTEYKVAYLKCMWDFSKGFHQKLQKLIDENAVDGWKLFNWKMSPMGEWCTVIFARETDDRFAAEAKAPITGPDID